MTKKTFTTRSSMELDLDVLLQSQTSSDEDDNVDSKIHRRTVDEILNDSDSSSSSSSDSPLISRSSSILLPKEPNQIPSPNALTQNSEIPAIEEETLGLSVPREKSVERRSIFLNRRLSGEYSGTSSGRSYSRPLPLLFGGIKPNPKPGAALAAAAAASRSVPSPHAAAIKFRRASVVQSVLSSQESAPSVRDSDLASDEDLGFGRLDPSDDRASSGFGSEIDQLNGKLAGEGDQVQVFPSPEVELVPGGCGNEDEAAETARDGDELCSSYEMQIKQVESVHVDGDELYSSYEMQIKQVESVHADGDEFGTMMDFNSSASIAFDEPQTSSGNENAHQVDENSTNADSVDVVEENAAPSSAEKENSFKVDYNFKLVENVESSGNSRSDANELLEDRLIQLESNKRGRKKAGKKSRSAMRPLEAAEELEKKYASSGLNWEEGAAAQPMRLEGIRRGPPAVGYLQIDPDNAITSTISSQAFMRDHGLAQVLAVHTNFVAVGTSKGVVLVLPSKYSAHSADKMDSKMLMLGSPGEKSHSAVTSMCFNQQGDLLLAGYGDGHLTVWDVQRAAAVKIITGEHTAPVVHTLFLGQDSQVTRQFKAVTGDCKGLVLLHASSVVPLLNRFSIKTQCLLDGQRTGTVLSTSPLLIDGSYGLASAQGGATVSPGGLGSMMGGVVGSEAGWKLFSEGSSLVEEGVVIFVTHQTALVVRLTPNLEVYGQLSKPDGVREGSMPYTAWKCVTHLRGSSAEQIPVEGLDKSSLLAIAWDRKVQVAKLLKSELKVYKEWTLDNAAIGVNWLDDQMLVVLTLRGQLCLFSKEGTELHRTSFVDGSVTSVGDDIIVYHTHFTNIFGNLEKAYHNSVAVRGATIYILGPTHLVVSRLLPWKERIQVLQKAGDWMGALDMAMRLYDGHAHGVIDLPRTLDAIRGAIMQYLVELILSYVDEVFSYISVAFYNQIGKVEQVDEPKTISSSLQSEIGEQFARVGGVAVEFCVHIKRTDILFDNIFSRFVAVQHGGTFLELLEPYILKDMLGCLPPEIMQALVEHYSGKGWLQRVEQCVLHMDISSLDFNQVVRLCREHGLYGALIYLFNKGLNDFKAPLEELLVVLQSSQRENSTSIGYRMLVYLKYCFLGLAFPPGHGTLPPALLPLLKIELIQFLLEDSNALNSQAVTNYGSSTRSFPNLCYLLWLDTEATLEVLKCAFFEEETPKSDNSLLGLVGASMEDNKENEIKNLENQNLIAQNIVNSLIHILDMEMSKVGSHSATDENGSIEGWPSKKDLGLLLEFIAYFVACKNATVSKNVLNNILEYLTSEGDHSPGVPSQKIETSRQREKQVVALLKVVPDTDWDASSLLRLCEKAQFYQVCGLIHTIRGDYVPALESYIEDVDDPIHAFAFINSMLLKLGDADSSFQSSVISRIPDLVNLSREGTFFLVIDHFSEQREHILSKLQSDRKSLFLYLKTVIEVHLSGTLKFSFLERDDVLDDPFGKRIKNQSNEIQAYLETLSNFPKILNHNSVNVTDEMTELYLELLCRFERASVLKFLKTFENYRLEHCLRLCQENGVTDAAAFLLERVGDVGSALQLTLSGLSEKLSLLGTALDSRFSEITTSSSTEMELFNTILRMTEVDAVLDVLHVSTGLCQRNTPRLDPQESEALWFQLLDSFCEPLRHLYDGKRVYDGRNRVDTLATASNLQKEKEAIMDAWRVLNSDKGAQIVRRLFSRFVREIIDGMVGYVPLPTIMAKLLSDNGNQEFGDFKLTILGMLGTYGYERRILDTAKSLIEDDSYYTMSLLKKGASHAYAPNSSICCLCGCSLTKDASTSSIRVFSCGHATHLQCEFPENEALKKDPSVGCPVCIPKKNPRFRSKSVFIENGLFENSLSRPQKQEITTGQRLHEFDIAEKPYMLQKMSRFEILSSLQKTQKSLQVEALPELRLTPPAIYHEKVKKGAGLNGDSSSSSLTKSEKPSKGRQLRELKSKKGLSGVRFPLKSNIFSSDKNKRR